MHTIQELLKLVGLRGQICANLISHLYNNIIALVVIYVQELVYLY